MNDANHAENQRQPAPSGQPGGAIVTISLPAVSIEAGARDEPAAGVPARRLKNVAGAAAGSGAPSPPLATSGGPVARNRSNSSSSQLLLGRARPARRELSVEDAGSILSMASTTSDVNSDDDAASIASRLSQIVSEQEFALMNLGARPAAEPAQRPSERGSLQKTRAQYKSTSSLAVKSPAGGVRLKQVRSSADLLVGQPAAAAAAGLERRDCDHREDDEEPFAAQLLGGQHEPAPGLGTRERAPNTSSGNLFQPERGDLKALETSRQQQLSAKLRRSNSFSRNQAAEMQAAAATTRQGAAPMLNICRSAWRLDEFEQAFKPAAESPEAAGAGTFSRADETRQRAYSMVADQPAARVGGGGGPPAHEQLSRQSSAFQDRNLLIRASWNVSQVIGSGGGAGGASPPIMSASNIWAQQANSQTSRGGGTGNGSLEPARRLSFQAPFEAPNALSMPGAGRQSRALSISSSIASSLDSFQSARPFGGLRKRARHQPTRVGAAAGVTPAGRSGCCRGGLQALRHYVPIFEWLPAYKLEYLWGDLAAGLAVAVLNISLCLSSAVVAETDMGAAFRASMVNTFFYALLCSSRHTSFGSWSIMSQMLLDCVRRALSDELILTRINLGPSASWSVADYEMWHMNIIVMYTFLIGLIQLLGGALGLGNLLASFIPEALCSSMIAATAFTMAVGQLANMCGTSNKLLWAIERNATAELAWADLKGAPVSITDLFAGTFRWIQQIALLLKHHEQINTTSLLISLISVCLLALNQALLQDSLRRLFNKKNLFVPFELLLLIAMIALSYWLQLREPPYSVATCGPIAIDFALPNVPNLRLVRELWFDALATALISFTMVYIMSKTYSNKLNYEIDSNQELIACGAGNLVGGLFDALPATGTFSRTASQVEAGGQTQMASLFNCAALLIAVKLFGHHVAQLPVCVMSAALFFGFVRMMARARDALTYWRLCKVDFAIWLVTFVAILTLDLVNGFVYSFIFSILTMLYRAQTRRCYLLGTIGPSADVFVPLSKYPLARELDAIKIFQFCGPIHYVSADLFERLLRQKTRVNVKQILQVRQEAEKAAANAGAQHKPASKLNGNSFEPNSNNNNNQVQQQQQQQQPRQLPTHIILDFSMISFIDSAGVHVLKKIIVDYERVDVTVMIAALASHVAAVVKSEPPLWEAHKDRFYVTLADAVHHAVLRNKQRQAARRKSNVSIQFHEGPKVGLAASKKDVTPRNSAEMGAHHQNGTAMMG